MAGSVTVIVTSGGKTVDPSYPLVSLEINQQINKISSAELVYLDTEGYIGKFKVSDDELFKPGKTIKIQVRCEGSDARTHDVFEGIIIQHRIKLDKDSALLVLELRHKAFKLVNSRHNDLYIDQTDQDIFNQIGSKYSDIEFIPKVNATIKHRQMMQSYCSDWDFLLSRAEANGWCLLAVGSNLRLVSITDLGNADGDSHCVLDLNSHQEVYALDMEVDISNQNSVLSASCWGVDKQELLTETIKSDQGVNFSSILDNFKKAIDGSDYQLIHQGDLTTEELKVWALGRLFKNDFSLLRGKIKTIGMPKVTVGMIAEVKSLTKYFNGKHIISRIRHFVNSEGFQTEIGIGMSADGLISMREVQAPPAGGMLPAMRGLQIAIVEEYEEKKSCELLVKVRLPFVGSKEKTLWARLASIYAGNEHGVVFRPEPGDEVILGFFNDDPRYPVILGSMYSAKNKLPVEFSKENKLKTIVTKEKVQILFDEENKAIILQTTDDNKISIATDGKEPGINLKDKNKNSFGLNTEGIGCISKGEIKIEAKKSITIEGTQVEVK